MNEDYLFDLFNQIIPLTSELKEAIVRSLKQEKFPRKHLLLSEGQTARRIYFISHGFARAYYFKKGKEITSWFMGKGDLMISVHSFFTQTPAFENIELLEESTLLSISFEQLQEIYKAFIEFNIIGRVLTEKYYILSEERAISLRMSSAKERYDELVKEHPEILLKAPLGQIASYLGITQETLSRIRAM